MLLLHQSGSVKVGEVVRYTVTYTPAVDRILPSPTHLHLKIKNTSAIALRAAFVHGPYTLYAAAYPSTYQPNEKFENPRRDGIPEFEPNLKAGASFYSQLSVPEDVRLSAGTARKSLSHEDPQIPVKSVSWIIEVASQVIFSNSAAVHYEIMLGRDEKSLSFGFSSVTGGNSGTPGQVNDRQQGQGAKDGQHNAQLRGVYSKSIKLKVEDTASLWNTPKFPEWDDQGREEAKEPTADAPVEKAAETKDQDKIKDEATDKKRKPKNIHLVLLTHGLHSNLGADMLYLKESIDAAAQQAKQDARARRGKERQQTRSHSEPSPAGSGDGNDIHDPTEQQSDETESIDEDEEVIVRGFPGNATKTERGIKFLGKRFAKYILSMTYPDQPYLPMSKSAQKALAKALNNDSSSKDQRRSSEPTHRHSTIFKEPNENRASAYKITSISFIGHSLGGLVQMYAVAYIQKHSPEFFDLIKPINFIALATPFLGLSNENPLYVKFALDFGLVGRTGQDLGLTWRAPTIARSGWGAIVSSLGESAQKRIDGEQDPGTKPLLRILPTGPAHIALKKFRHRTVYSNVVNDGIVPLRTSCLLFLDWQGLGRVEKARRENGFVGTMAGWTWSEFTGANSSTANRSKPPWSSESDSENPTSGANTPTKEGHGELVPEAEESANVDDDSRSLRETSENVMKSSRSTSPIPTNEDEQLQTSSTSNNGNPFSTLLGLFKSNSSKSHNHPPKSHRIYRRSQTLNFADESAEVQDRPKATRGDSVFGDSENLSAPPKTTVFEAAGDLLNPPLPPVEFLIDPSKRPRTIFHDRVYHPEDIPSPPLKHRHSTKSSRPGSSSNKTSSNTPHSPTSASQLKLPDHHDSTLSTRDYDDTVHTSPNKDPLDVIDSSAMKVEEKIARAYHRDLSWRKVLVRLEPDAHNNIVVRRMLANANGWPVIKHLVDTHFSDREVAFTRDSQAGSRERAKASGEKPSSEGDETKASSKDYGGDASWDSLHPSDARKHRSASRSRQSRATKRSESELREAKDEVPAMESLTSPTSQVKNSMAQVFSPPLGNPQRKDSANSATWSDRDFWTDDSDDESGTAGSPPPENDRSTTNSGGFSWTEAIIGRGNRGRSYSPSTRHSDLAYGDLRDRTRSPLNISAEEDKMPKGQEKEAGSSQPATEKTDALPGNNDPRNLSGECSSNRVGLRQAQGTQNEAVESISERIAQTLGLAAGKEKEKESEVD